MTTADRVARFERSLSLLVGLAAIVAAVAALYQTALARRQARAAARPYLSQANSLTTGSREQSSLVVSHLRNSSLGATVRPPQSS